MKYIYLLLISCIIFSCSTDTNENDSIDNYNRIAILENLTNNIIIPSYEQLQSKMIQLNISSFDFKASQNSSNLTALRKSWKETYIAWQYVEMFNLGKAEEIDFNKAMNTYPCNTTIINQNISNSQYNLSSSDYSSWSSQGLPAVDYMLYGLDNDSNNILNIYSGNDGEKYLNYLEDIISQMLDNTNKVTEYWKNNKDLIISSNGNTATSSLNLLTNDFIYFYEKGIRANKIGIPCGRWDDWDTYPIGVEAYYRKDLSKRLTLSAINSCVQFFSGVGLNTGTDGQSFDDYLNDINGDNDLTNDIINKLTTAEEKINSLDNNFTLQMSTDNTKMVEAYDALQKVVVHLKTDMLISLSITVDYADADGD